MIYEGKKKEEIKLKYGLPKPQGHITGRSGAVGKKEGCRPSLSSQGGTLTPIRHTLNRDQGEAN